MTKQTINLEILDYIYSNIAFRDDVTSYFPVIRDSILLFIANPNCSCKNTILKYLWDNKDTSYFNMLQMRWQSLPFIVSDGDITIPVSINKREMFGEVVVIPSTREAYRNLIKRAREEQWIFHGFTVTETKRKWKVYFY